MKRKRILKPVAMLLVVIMIFSLAPDMFMNIAKYFRTTQISGSTINTDDINELVTDNDDATGNLAVPELNPELSTKDEVILGAPITVFGSASFPATIGELEALGTKTFYIRTYMDWLNIQELSTQSSLEGYTFVINNNNTPGVPDSSTYELASLTQFTGIGTEEFPFKGTLRCSSTNGINYTIARPIFAYLGGGATVRNIHVVCTGSCSAGLAAVLTGGGELKLENIFVSGTINTDNCAGGLFGEIINTEATPLTFSVTREMGASQNGVALGVTKTDTAGKTKLTISGKYAGNIAGKVTGNVLIKYDGSVIDIKNTTITGKVADGAKGWIAGYMVGDGNVRPEITFISDTSLYPLINGNGASGGLVGKCENAVIGTGDYKVTVESSKVDGSGNRGATTHSDIYGLVGNITEGTGGIVGSFINSEVKDNSTFYVQNIMLKTNNGAYGAGGIFGYVYNSDLGSFASDDEGYFVGNVAVGYNSDAPKNAGGIIGVYINETGELIKLDHFNVWNTFIQGISGTAGGVIGYMNLVNGTDCELSDWYVAGTTPTNSGGGNGMGYFAGYILSDEDEESVVTVKGANISQQRDDDFGTYRSIYVGATYRLWGSVSSGAIAGKMSNTNLVAENIIINSLQVDSANNTGGLVGHFVSGNNKKYIYVNNFAMKGTYKSNGGAGVNYGYSAVVGNLDTNSILALDGVIDLSEMKWDGGGFTYAGQIVGRQDSALVFLNHSGEIKPYGNTGNYVDIDMVGNYGDVYVNGKWDGVSGEYIFNIKTTDAINGTVEKIGDVYNLKTVGDMLRLAIMWNSYGAFASECFEDTYSDMFKMEYHLIAEEYDLSGTGFTCFQRNDESNVSNIFSGKFIGTASGKSKIKYNVSRYRQPAMGLFRMVGNTDTSVTEFKNIAIDAELMQDSTSYTGEIKNGRHYYAVMGGLSVTAQGNITVENVDIDVDMSGCYHNHYTAADKGYYGGLFGKYTSTTNSVLDIKGLYATGHKVISDTSVCGAQVIAWTDCNSGAPSINFEDVVISGTIESNRNDYVSMIGGLIAVANNYNNRDQWRDYRSYTFKNYINVKDIVIEGLTVNNAACTYTTGGLLGFRWTNVIADIENLTIRKDANGKGNVLNASKRNGGMFAEVTGRLNMENVNISDWQYNMTNTILEDYPGLIVSEGKVLYLSVKDYNIDTATTIIKGAPSNFDELAGLTTSGVETGGVVSISSSTVDYLSPDSGYRSYKNQATYEGRDADSLRNNSTRYYYNVPEIIETALNANGGVVLKDGVISSPEELMIFGLTNYAHGHIKPFFVVDTGTNYNNILNTHFNYSGVIDLGGYSYYPTSITNKKYAGINDATIIFHAQEMLNGEALDVNGQRYSDTNNNQHYMMHSGLFYSLTATEVKDMTIKGTVSCVGNTSGALAVGYIRGVNANAAEREQGFSYSTTAKTTISNIILDNVWIAGTDDMKNRYGLLVHGIINGAKADINGVRMVNYDDSRITTESNKAAAALIGYVGGSTGSAVREINVTFQNMDVADVADTVTLPNTTVPDLFNSTEADKVLAYASFIYQYEYYEDTCWGLYTFYQADYLKGKGLSLVDYPMDANATLAYEDSLGLVTMGYEIGDEVEFYDSPLTTPISDYAEYGFDADNYKPYVYNYKRRQIFVNAKPGDITKGCGTYEDPYIIEYTKQFKTLYYYLKDNTGVLHNWKVNSFGNDTTFCTGTHAAEALKVYGSTDFPTKDELNQAYYKIIADIDFTDFSDFVGFGTEAEPFVGVFVGGLKPNDQYPDIKLNNETTNNEVLTSYGFIRYAKGCVLKDLNIILGNTQSVTEVNGTSTTTYDYIKVQNAGAGAIAYVIGGDNVIDNVTVNGTIKLATGWAGRVLNVGGYAGQVRLGTLILRNMDSDSLAEFNVVDDTNAEIAADDTYTNYDRHIWVNGIVGSVKDGAVLYENYADNTFPVFTDTTAIYSNTAGLRPMSDYNIINAAYIKNSGKGTITVTDGKITVNADNAAQLMMYAIALNSGAFTYRGISEGAYYIGYNEEARCRNGNYDKVGNVLSADDTVYVDVIKYDNINGGQPNDGSFFAPYAFDYFNVDVSALMDGITDTPDNYMTDTVLSKYINLNANDFTLVLSGALYDMAVYELAFRGIGAEYISNTANNFNVFKGNITGNNSKINLNYISDVRRGLKNIGLINQMRIEKQTDACVISDITLSGNVINTSGKSDAVSIENAYGESVTGYTAAGLIGKMTSVSNIDGSTFLTAPYNYYFKNISTDGLTVKSLEFAGGIVGRLEIYNGTDYKVCYGYDDCTIKDTTCIASADVGGIIASFQNPYNVTFNDCDINGLTLEGKGVYRFTYNNRDTLSFPSAGGYIGRGIANNSKTIVINGGSINGIDIKSTGHSGGLIGQTECSITMNAEGDTFTGDDITMRGTGVLGNQEIPSNSVEFLNWNNTPVEYRGRYLGSHGGLFGFVGNTLSLNNATLTNVDIEIRVGSATNGWNGGNLSSQYPQTFIGGMAGIAYKDTNLTNCILGSDTTDIRLVADAGYGESGWETAYTETSTRHNRVGVGGLVGAASNTGNTSDANVNITDCKVIGNPSGDNIIRAGYTAGGMISELKIATNKNAYYQNCTVSDMDISATVHAGGISGAEISAAISRFNNVNVEGCNISNLDVYRANNNLTSGGFTGCEWGIAFIHESNVTDCTIGGPFTYYAGGYFGYTPTTFGACKFGNATSVGNTIMGAMAGGIAGRVSRNQTNQGALYEIIVKGNKIIGFFNNDNERTWAGGTFAYTDTTNNNVYGNDIVIEDNLIAGMHLTKNTTSNQCIGGVFGEIKEAIFINDITLNDNIIGILDYSRLPNDTSDDKYITFGEYLINDVYDLWDASHNLDAAKVAAEEEYIGLYFSDTRDYVPYPDVITEAELYKYAAYVGLIFGYRSSGVANITDFYVNYSDEFKKFRPASDVAANSIPGDNTAMYDYRNRYHIVYGGKNFSDLESIWDEYFTETGDARHNYRLDHNYNQGVTMEDILQNTYYDTTLGAYQSPFKDALGNAIPLVVYDNTDLDKIISSYVNIITNNGGAIKNNSYQSNIIKVSAQKMKLVNGVPTVDATLTPSITPSTTGATTQVTLNINSKGYDTYTDDQNGTYTVLNITYTWSNTWGSKDFGYGPDANDKYVNPTLYETATISIPIFIKKILEIDTHITGISGSIYNIENIVNDGIKDLSILRGVYTSYIEYDYNDAIGEYPYTLDKELYFLQNNASGAYVPIFANTKFTLIDLSDSKVYYYKADSDITGRLPLSAFKASDGTAYTEPAINTLDLVSGDDKTDTLHRKHYAKEVGGTYNANEKIAMQRYLLLVDTSEVTTDTSSSYTYVVNVKPIDNAYNRNFLSKCKYPIEPDCDFTVTEIPGIAADFTGETYVTGEIKEDSLTGVNSKIEFELTASQSYWDYKNSSPSELKEYIDVAIYLEKDGIKTPLPLGTMVTYNKGQSDAVSISTAGETILYFYKDFFNEYSLANVTRDTIVSGTLDFDFTQADFSDFEDGNYIVTLELLKTAEKEFPMGGVHMDTYTTEFNTLTEKNIGFVLIADDLMNLGMNGYLPEESDKGVIDFTTNIDFTDYIPKTDKSNKLDFEALAKKYFSIKYEIMRKVKNPDGSYSYVPYEGDGIELLWDDRELGFDKCATFRLSETTLITGNRGMLDHVVEYPCTVRIDVEQFLAENELITNYRVVGRLYVSDTAPDGVTVLPDDSDVMFMEIPDSFVSQMSLSDYFVYTIAKIKTDLDI